MSEFNSDMELFDLEEEYFETSNVEIERIIDSYSIYRKILNDDLLYFADEKFCDNVIYKLDSLRSNLYNYSERNQLILSRILSYSFLFKDYEYLISLIKDFRKSYEEKIDILTIYLKQYLFDCVTNFKIDTKNSAVSPYITVCEINDTENKKQKILCLIDKNKNICIPGGIISPVILEDGTKREIRLNYENLKIEQINNPLYNCKVCFVFAILENKIKKLIKLSDSFDKKPFREKERIIRLAKFKLINNEYFEDKYQKRQIW